MRAGLVRQAGLGGPRIEAVKNLICPVIIEGRNESPQFDWGRTHSRQDSHTSTIVPTWTGIPPIHGTNFKFTVPRSGFPNPPRCTRFVFEAGFFKPEITLGRSRKPGFCLSHGSKKPGFSKIQKLLPSQKPGFCSFPGSRVFPIFRRRCPHENPASAFPTPPAG